MLDKACVAMLCMFTTMLLGFSNPPKTAAAPVPDSVKAVADALSFPPRVAPMSAARKTARPFSLAGNVQFGAILGGVSTRAWIADSENTPDWTIVNQGVLPVGQFHGVGFPDIRTHQRPEPSPYDAPGPWAPLVAWRDVQGEPSGIEPIARVRCMGLSPHAVARRADRYKDMIYTYADRYEVSRHLVKAVITEESCFNNNALSHVGAQGLMQLMPDTASWLKVKDSHDPAQNLKAGVRYLASLKKEFDSVELALAAYNAGPGNVRRYDGIPPFAETQAYVVKVQAHYRRYVAAHDLLVLEEQQFEQPQAHDSVFVP